MEKYISNIKTPKISIAPMVDKSHRHFRYFCRIMNKEALLYSEMVTAQAIINGDLDRILYFREDEGSVALQIAASNPEDAYKAVKLAEKYNYSEINLNCGCPSDQSGSKDSSDGCPRRDADFRSVCEQACCPAGR